jgi:AcrR family transcriptional regulator
VSPAAAAPKPSQRERLHAGIVHAVVRHGYADATVSHVIKHAHVSRPTFYEHYRDKQHAFLATHEELARELVARVGSALDGAAPAEALVVAIHAQLELAQEQPAHALYLTDCTLAAGPPALNARDALLEELTAVVEGVLGGVGESQSSALLPPSHAPDLPTRLVLGSLQRLLPRILRRSARDLPRAGVELGAWADRYNRALAQHRWRALQPGPPPPRSPHITELALERPPPLRPGRPRISEADVAHNQRQRIMLAAAELAVRQGYAATTIAEIAAAAQLERSVFYARFPDKQSAYLAIHDLTFQQLLAVGSSGYFRATTWPEQIWQGLCASTQWLAENPLLAHTTFVESHAIGGAAMTRVEDYVRMFGMFLAEGGRYSGREVAACAVELVADCVVELAYLLCREGRVQECPRFDYLAAYVELGGWLGAEGAEGFVKGKTEAALAFAGAATSTAARAAGP